MTQHSELTPAEMDAETVSALPDREAMSLLDLTANLDLSLDLAAPVDAAIAANANVAAPIDAAVAANVASIDSSATAVAQQTAIINQDLDGVTAEATADQDSEITQ